jgi:hypothetical protein
MRPVIGDIVGIRLGFNYLGCVKRDKWALYEAAVQSPGADVALITGIYRRRRGRIPKTLCEHFCGSAALSDAWVRSDRTRSALGIDRDRRALERARAMHKFPLGSDGDRLQLSLQDVREPARSRFDVVVAYNFSYCAFKQRIELAEYFRAARRSLAKSGMLFIDVFGGVTAMQPSIEPHRRAGCTYVWEQASFDPLTNRLVAHIHFLMDDKTRLHRAFTYDWRLWQIPELRELLLESGFRRVDVYWEDRDPAGMRTGRFRRRTKVTADPSWTAYLIAEP